MNYLSRTYYFIVFLVLIQSSGITAQDTAKPYYFDGNDVVFVFDVRNYASALQGEDARKVDFADLDVYHVAISGDFNNWSRKGWKMQRKGEFVFELRKKIADFNDPFPIEFKYIINGKYLADPDGTIDNTLKFSDGFLEDVYKLDLSVLKVSEQGNVVFTLQGHYNAQEVILAGSFNGWDEHAIKMDKATEGWRLRAELPPGRYEYKFIVDGEWTHDIANKESVLNEHGTLNSVLWVSVPVKFTLKGYQNARNVVLAGSFNGWNEQKLRMTREDGVWAATVDLPGGKQLYKFIVDGIWITDPVNPVTEDDGYGNKNSVLFVH